MTLSRRQVMTGLAAAPLAGISPRASAGVELAAAARRQIGVTKDYDGAYRKLAYPNGDAPASTGVCADVIVRAARVAWGLDLQKLVHEDMASAFKAYPQRWGLTKPDANIDHRRVPNLETYWRRHGAKIWEAVEPALATGFPGTLAVGDILTWRGFPQGGPHVAIVSHVGTWPRVIQNHGFGTREDLLLLQWLDAAVGHYRWGPTGKS